MTAPADAERRRLEREIRRLRHELDAAVDALPHLRQMVQFSGDLLILAAADGRILEANGRLAAVLGVPQAALYGRPLQDWLANPGQARVLAAHLAAAADPQPLRMELDLQPGGGEPLAMELEAHPLEAAEGAAAGTARWTLALRDIGLRRRLESSEAARQVQIALIASLRSSEARYRELVAQLADGLAQVDAGGAVLFANPALHRILAVPEGALLGRRLSEFLPEQARASFAEYWGAVLAGRSRRFALPLRADDGSRRQVELEIHPRRDGVGEPVCGAVASLLLRDVTQLHAALAELTALAFRDPLTGLANAEASRRELERRLASAVPRPCLVLWLDLDGFRRINHSQGRAAGDALLRRVADRLRSWASHADLLARVGGDEFLLLRDLAAPAEDPAALRREAETLLAALRQQLAELAGSQDAAALPLAFSAGYSLAPLQGTQAEGLLQAAATALSRAREVAPGTALAYEPGFTSALRRELELEAALRQALAASGAGLRLVYQPQCDGQGRLVGAEALLRWRDPLHGVVAPSRFVPLAERSGLIHQLGSWVLEAACRQLRAWLDAGLQPPRLAVNLSPRQFEGAGPTPTDQVAAALERHGLPPALLELELTESCILPAGGVIPQVQDLAAMGVALALDDFGTGYSSLAVLNRLPIQKLKIDRSFIRNLESSASARTIVSTALAMGSGLGLVTLAEGVETAGQLAVLESLGCQTYQGYWFSRPLEAEAYGALLPPQGLPAPQDQDGETGSRPAAHHAP